MKGWKDALVTANCTILETINIINSSAMQIALVVDENNLLLGTVTDGDIRRGLLRGISLSESVETVMNIKPTVAHENQSKSSILTMMKNKRFHQIPLVTEKGVLVGMESLDNLIKGSIRDNHVIIMAGGLGSRLQPLTNTCPKPLLKVGSKPILETIVDNFVEYGFSKFYISVNYKAEMIKEYFGDGSKYGIQIKYLEENQRLGTAGALSLLPELPIEPVLVMNGDLLTKVNFQHLLDFHLGNKAKATMCVREYSYQIPYGVVNISGGKIKSIEEKPVQSCFVNAGIYVLNPEVIQNIPSNTYFDMPELFKNLALNKKKAIAFPIREYWMDIGQMDDFEKAQGEFWEVFG